MWGRHDEIFAAAGAEAFRRDVPAARVELLDGGHFLLESALDEVAPVVREFLAAALAREPRAVGAGDVRGGRP